MTVVLRRFGGGMTAWVVWSFLVAGVLVLWDAATRLWFFDALSRLDIGAAQNPGFGSSLLRSVLGLFLGAPVWPIWAAPVGASVAVLASSKLGRYRVAALFGIGFGPALSTILESGSPVSGNPMALLVPVWLLVIAADMFLTWGLAWCILTLPKRAAMAKRRTGELRPLGGFPVIGWPEGIAALFAGGESSAESEGAGEIVLMSKQRTHEHRGRLDRAKAQREFSCAV